MGARRHEPRQPRVRLRRAARSSPTRSARTSRSSRPTSSRRPRARRPTGWTARPCSTSNGVRVGVIGATVRTTPELVRADATAGLVFLDEAERIRAESERLRAAGVRGAGRGHPRGRRARRQRGRRPPGGAVAGADRRHRAGAAGHDDRPGDRRPHAPAGEHDGRPHPGRRGLQRRRELLRGPADAARTATSRWAGHGDAARQEPRRRRAGRRAGDRRRGQRRDGGAAQRGDRDAGRRHPARSDAPERVGHGQPRGRRDARPLPGRGRRADQLGRPARRPAVDAAVGGRAARRDHLGRGVRRAAVRQPHGDRDA